MQVLILDDDSNRAARLLQALAARGLQVTCAETLPLAEAMVRRGLPSLLILAERVGGRLSHALALLAGCGDRPLPVIFITPRQGDDAAELFDMIPSALSLVGPGVRPETMADIAQAALAGAPITPALLGGSGRVVPVAAGGAGGAVPGVTAGMATVAADPAPGHAAARPPHPQALPKPPPRPASGPANSAANGPASRAERARALSRLPSLRPALTLA